MKNILLGLILALLCVSCFAQSKKIEDSTAVGLCWSSQLDSNGKYLVYYRKYNEADTTWTFLGMTTTKEYWVSKNDLKGDIVFGVKSIWYNDTSLMHSSLDNTACSEGNVCGDSCGQGSWYMNWHIKKAKNIKTKK
jgi:hypothetical protein